MSLKKEICPSSSSMRGHGAKLMSSLEKPHLKSVQSLYFFCHTELTILKLFNLKYHD